MSFFKDENGQSLVEYGLILGMVAVVAIVAIVAVGHKNAGVFSYANEEADKALAAN